mmetsp:Transcript_17130/g.29625  ORF Transcript_17130/g.29625 Transcript_17130/m.29625 type:complete len:317 (-) Transcript_17130:210-1160(-)
MFSSKVLRKTAIDKNGNQITEDIYLDAKEMQQFIEAMTVEIHTKFGTTSIKKVVANTGFGCTALVQVYINKFPAMNKARSKPLQVRSQMITPRFTTPNMEEGNEKGLCHFSILGLLRSPSQTTTALATLLSCWWSSAPGRRATRLISLRPSGARLTTLSTATDREIVRKWHWRTRTLCTVPDPSTTPPTASPSTVIRMSPPLLPFPSPLLLTHVPASTSALVFAVWSVPLPAPNPVALTHRFPRPLCPPLPPTSHPCCATHEASLRCPPLLQLVLPATGPPYMHAMLLVSRVLSRSPHPCALSHSPNLLAPRTLTT